MNDIQTLLIVLAILVGVGVILAFVLPYLKRRGVDMQKIIDQANNALAVANNTFETIRPFLQDAPGVGVFDDIMAAARVGVGNAEQLYHIGQLEPAQRKDAARQYVLQVAKLTGIEVTPEVEKLIDGAIEAEVLELGHLKKLTN